MNGHTEKGLKVVKTACLVNKREFRSDLIQRLKKLENSANKSGRVAELFKYPGIRRNTLLVCFCWFSFTMAYFGIIYNTPAFDWNLFIVFSFPAMLDLPLSIALPFAENTLGRKLPFFILMVTAGLAFLFTIAFDEGIVALSRYFFVRVSIRPYEHFL